MKLSKRNKYEVFESGGGTALFKNSRQAKKKKKIQNTENSNPKGRGGGVVLYANCIGFGYKRVEQYLKQACWSTNYSSDLKFCMFYFIFYLFIIYLFYFIFIIYFIYIIIIFFKIFDYKLLFIFLKKSKNFSFKI